MSASANTEKATDPTQEATTAPAEEINTNPVAKEKKVEIRIPIDQLNPSNGSVPVCINGYIWQIKRGETVEVPKSVAALLRQANYI